MNLMSKLGGLKLSYLAQMRKDGYISSLTTITGCGDYSARYVVLHFLQHIESQDMSDISVGEIWHIGEGC